MLLFLGQTLRDDFQIFWREDGATQLSALTTHPQPAQDHALWGPSEHSCPATGNISHLQDQGEWTIPGSL